MRGYQHRVLLAVVALGFSCIGPTMPAQEIVPVGPSDEFGRYSDRTLVVGIEIDRDEAKVLSYTVKPRPFVRPVTLRPARGYSQNESVQIEVILSGSRGERYTRRVEIGPMCLSHGPEAESHILGDTILHHRDSFLVELPELAGMDRVEVAFHEKERGAATRKSLGSGLLDEGNFTAAATAMEYRALAFAEAGSSSSETTIRASTVIWPEDLADPEIYHVYGDVSAVQERINIVIVPDGYTYAEKALMKTHADETVAHFRAKTPHGEHDIFHNYILVYAYSHQSGTDQCDCDIVLNTAMGTRFPEPNPTCGHTDNRCLSYGGSCDTSGTSNIVAAELRAPAHDETMVMVNTARYGGCGGLRATYSAGNSSAKELAVHELGHSMAGLADEYFYNSNCGSFAGGINTSTDAVSGAWAEWIGDLGAPKEGGQYYGQCIYRPENNCEMRSLGQPFCAVCNQRWSLFTFGHFRVTQTAPIRSMTPGASANATTLVETNFSVDTRLSSGGVATNEITWTLDGPGLGGPTIVAGATTSYAHTFTLPGTYNLTCEVIGDTNFVKPSRYGANRDSADWTIEVSALLPPQEISPVGSPEPLGFSDSQNLYWEDAAAASTYNLYRGNIDQIQTTYGSCVAPELPANGTTSLSNPAPGAGWFFLATGKNPAGEGPMGFDSQGSARVNANPCGAR